MTATPRFSMPFLSAGQAQKELFHNEALQTLDIAVAAAVEGPPAASPPAQPVVGQCFIVAEEAGGEWAGRSGALAAYTSGGWRFIPPVEGLSAVIKSSGETAQFRSGSWRLGVVACSKVVVGGQQVVGPRAGPIADPAGGPNADVEARAAIASILAALRTHGLVET